MGKARIMVVEDEGVVAMAIREALEGLGYEVPRVAMSGEEAVAKVLETEPDLVLMDIQLRGGVNGIESARRIRQRLDVPVVYLTAFSDDQTLEQAQLTEPYGYVLKPFEERSLHAVIQMALMKHRRTRGARESGWWMSAVAESMIEGVVICDPKGYVTFANPAAEALVGRGRGELLGARIAEAVSLVDAERRAPMAFPVTEPLLEGRSTARANCRVVAAGGREVPVELSASPLRSPEGTLFGVLYVFRETTERERVQVIVQRELEELSRAQRQVLPSRETAVPGIRYDWLSLASPLGGGDSLGCAALDESHAGFWAVDVVGQGFGAALFSVLLHTFLSPAADLGGVLVEKTCEPGGAGRRVRGPAEVVKELGRRFALRDETKPFFTIAYGVMDARTGVARIARAGHPFPLLVAGGRAHAVKPEGYAVGLFPAAEPAVEEVTLARGDRLVLYSDGVVECTNAAGARYTQARLAEKLVAGAGTPLDALVSSLRDDLAAWRGGEPFADDASLMIVEREGAGS